MSGSKRKAAQAGLSSPPAPSKKRVVFEPDALARAALIEHTTFEDSEAATKAQQEKWKSMSGDEKRERTAKVVRYMLLSYGSGNGVIDESDVKKVALGGRGEIHPRSVMEAAAEALRDTFGLEAVRVISPPTKEDLEDKSKKAAIAVRRTSSWLLRRLGAGRAPPLGDEGGGDAGGDGDDDEEFQDGGIFSRIAHPSRMAKDAAGSVDGLTLAQRGLLMVVCVAIMLEPAKAIREDALWAHLHAADPERFPTDVGRDAVRKQEVAAKAEAAGPSGEGNEDGDAGASSSSSSSAAGAGEAAGAGGSAAGPVDRSLMDWRAFVSRELVRMQYLTRRLAAAEGIGQDDGLGGAGAGAGAGRLATGAAAAKTESTGDSNYAYRLGARARQTIGPAALLGVVEQVTGRCWERQDVAGNMGVEFALHDELLATNPVVMASFEDKAARAAKALARQSGAAAGAGGDGEEEEDGDAPASSPSGAGKRKGGKGVGSKGKGGRR